MNQEPRSGRCNSAGAASQGRRAGQRVRGGLQVSRVGHCQVVREGQRGLPVLRRSAHGLRFAGRFAAGVRGFGRASASMQRVSNTGRGLFAAHAASFSVGKLQVRRQGRRGLSVLRRPAHGWWCVGRFASKRGGRTARSGTRPAMPNTGHWSVAVAAASANTPNHSVKPTCLRPAAYLKR